MNTRKWSLALALLVTVALALSMETLAAGGSRRPVLGSAAFAKPYGEGFGSSAPAKIFNGGDPSGLVAEVRWVSWGGKVAVGFGLNSIFKPAGGYYSQRVIIELRAQRLGKCNSGGPRAYTQLAFRAPSRPEGPLGPWRLWSEAKSIC